MANRATALEQVTEEFNRLDQELKLLQKELEDTLQLNDNFQKSIEQKGEELAAKDEYLLSLREKNAAEVEQLKLEEVSSRDTAIHEINFHTVELYNLKIKQQRLQELRDENHRLKASIDYLQEQTNKDRLHHALAMHDMNKEMKILRQQMEQKLRKELAGLELSFQEEAFNALQDKQKKAMLENAKLKDEVALQGVGIANLTSRLIKQQLAHEKCQKVLTKYEKKSLFLRERLAEATITKNHLLKQREILLKDEYELLQEKERLTQILDINNLSGSAPGTAVGTAANSANASITNEPSPSQSKRSPRRHGTPHRYTQTMTVVNDLINRYTQSKETYRNRLGDQTIWIQRYDSIKNIFIDLRPMNDLERNGNFLRKHFPLQELIQDITLFIQQQTIIDPYLHHPYHNLMNANNNSNVHNNNSKFMKFDKPLTPLIQSENSSVTGGGVSTASQGSEVLLEIQKIIKQDIDLAEALKHLKGKESSILSAFQDNSEEKKAAGKPRTAGIVNEDEEDEDEEGGVVAEGTGKLKKEFSITSSKKDEDKDQNMIAWTVLKIICLWYGADQKAPNPFDIDAEIDELEARDGGEYNKENYLMNGEEGYDDYQDTSFEQSDVVWLPLHEEKSPLPSPLPAAVNLDQSVSIANERSNIIQQSSLEKYSSLSTNSQLQEPYYYEQQQPPREVHYDLDEHIDKQPIEALDEWEAKMLQEIQQARLQDANQILADKKDQETGVEYYDHPPETSSWLYKVPPRPSKLSVFTNEIKGKLVPKKFTLSLKEREEYRKDCLQLADIGPPILIHEFLSPLKKRPNSSTLSPSGKSEVNNIPTITSHTMTNSSKPQLQRRESQILHYDCDRDPLLFNQKKKNLTLPKSPNQPGSVGDSTDHHSFYKKETVSDRTLPRKLVIALSKTASTPLFAGSSKPNTPSLEPLNAGFGKSNDSLLGKKKLGGRTALSHSTGALLSLK